jgi:DNA repair exonuclease SbcCD nuclease subunit
VEVVVLPGNHDPLTADSVYNRTAFADLPRVRILGRGAPAGEQIAFAGLDLAVWGRAHWDYEDSFDVDAGLARTTLRPLRQPTTAASA